MQGMCSALHLEVSSQLVMAGHQLVRQLLFLLLQLVQLLGQRLLHLRRAAVRVQRTSNPEQITSTANSNPAATQCCPSALKAGSRHE